MFFKQLATKESSLSYFFGCGTKGKSMAVDVVAGDEEWYIEEAKKANVTINYVIDTHVHADHYSGGRKLAQMVGAPYCLHESDTGLVKFKFEPLSDGQSLNLGNVEVEVLHTPGHTPDSICLLVTDMRRGELPWFVITGDTLFVGSTGTPRLAGARAGDGCTALRQHPYQVAASVQRSRAVPRSSGWQRVRRRIVRQAEFDHRLRETLEPRIVDEQGSFHRETGQ